jgi:hypothetical protein
MWREENNQKKNVLWLSSTEIETGVFGHEIEFEQLNSFSHRSFGSVLPSLTYCYRSLFALPSSRYHYASHKARIRLVVSRSFPKDSVYTFPRSTTSAYIIN